jgi:hypothetical protein
VPTGCGRRAVGERSLHSPISARNRRFSTNRDKLNRQTPEVERFATYRKQRTALSSNRQKINFSPYENQPLNAFLPGTALRVQNDVTNSKQNTATSLPGTRTPQLGTRTIPPDAHCNARSSIANALSNRELQLLEPRLIHRKQTIALRSNRELSTNRCRGNSHRRIVCVGGGCCKAPIGRLAVPVKTRSGDGRGLLWRGEKSLTIGGREILVQGR